MLEKNPTISLIFVNYRSGKYLRKAIESIFLLERGDDLEIVIVNNDVNETKEIASLGLRENVRTIETGENKGFGYAANRGAVEARGSIVGFLNPDILWTQRQLEKIKERVKNDAIIGLGLFDENNIREKYGFGRRVNFWRLIENHLFQVSTKVTGRKRVDWVSGGALFCPKRIFDELSGFDERYFLYYEDVDFCERARIRGYKAYVYEDLRVTHFRGKSQESFGKQKKDYYTSQKYYFQKNAPKI